MPLFGHFKAHPEQLDQLLALLELDHEVPRPIPRPSMNSRRERAHETFRPSIHE
jgi:hypothetical protein